MCPAPTRACLRGHRHIPDQVAARRRGEGPPSGGPFGVWHARGGIVAAKSSCRAGREGALAGCLKEGAMEAHELLISSDSHVLEPADLWVKGLPASLRDRAPRVYFDEAASTWMFGSEDVSPQPVTFSFVAGVDLDNLPEMHKKGYSAA